MFEETTSQLHARYNRIFFINAIKLGKSIDISW
jgi:hypothetical protein